MMALADLWALLVPLASSLAFAIVAYLLRPRLTILGMRHPNGAGGMRYRFNLYYREDVPFRGVVRVAVRLVGAGAIVGTPKLLAGPGYDRGPVASPAGEADTRRLLFSMQGIRPRATWVLQFETNGDERNAVVKVDAPYHGPVHAVASPVCRSWRLADHLPSPLFILTLVIAVASYMLLTDATGLLGDSPLRQVFGPQYLAHPENGDGWIDTVIVATAIVAIVAVYDLCVRRRVAISNGYLGWHPGVRDHDRETQA